MSNGNEERYAQTILDFRNENQQDFAALVNKYSKGEVETTPQKRRHNTTRERLVDQQEEIKQAFLDGKTSSEVAYDYGVCREYIIVFVKDVFGKEFYYDHVFYGGKIKNG